MRFAASTRKLAPIYAQNNTRTPNDNSHAAIPMRSASTDSKTPYNYAHTSTPKAASSHRYTAAKKKRQTDRSRTRRTHEVPFIVACSHFTRKNTRFRAPASSPKHSPCNIMQPFQCDLQPDDLPPFIEVKSIASYSFAIYCYVMYCYVIYHPSSRSIP